MSKLDSTDMRDQISGGSSALKPKSAAASRILRAVEKSRSGGDSPARSESETAPSVVAADSAERIAPPDNHTMQTPAPSPISAEGRAAEESATPAISVRVSTPSFDPLEAEETLRSLSAQQLPHQLSPELPSPVAQTKRLASEPLVAVPAVTAEKPDGKNDRKTAPAAKETPVQEAKASKETPGKAKNSRDRNSSATTSAAAEPENPADATPTFSMSGPVNDSFLARVPSAIKAGAFLLLLVGGGAAFYKFSGATVDAKGPRSSQDTSANVVFVPMSGVGGWSPSWGGDTAKAAGRSISMFRPSLQQVNYRIDFEGQIEQKGFGWVFRASDPQNFYCYKVEVVKPGLQPLVALARFSMINGVESQKHYTLLDKPVRPDTVFKIRMDANKQQFKTWINDHLVETWTDDRLNSGGLGLFMEKSEAAQIRKVQIFEMR